MHGEAHKAPWWKYKNGTKFMKRNLSVKPFPEYLKAFKHAQYKYPAHYEWPQTAQTINEDEKTMPDDDELSNPSLINISDVSTNTHTNVASNSTHINVPSNSTHINVPSTADDMHLPSLDILDAYSYDNPNKLSQLSHIYHDLLYIPTLFDVKPERCSQENNNNNDSHCSFRRKNVFTWQYPVITFQGLFKLNCYHQYCSTHHKFVQREVLLQLCLQRLGVSVYQSGRNMLTSFGVHSLLRNVFLLQTNVSLVLSVANALILGMLDDRITAWKANAPPQQVSLLKQILSEATDDESAKALQPILMKRGKITTFCYEVSDQIHELAMKLFDNSLITDCKIIDGIVLCQINFDATFDAGENVTSCGKSLRSVVANFCTNQGKVSNPPILARSENTKLFVEILSKMCNKVFEHFVQQSQSFLFLLVLDDTKSYVNLPNHLSTRLKTDSVVDLNHVKFQILLAEDRMHRVGRWHKQMPKSLHQYSLFLRCISSHHARAEKGSIKLSSDTKMNVDQYYNKFFVDKWKDRIKEARDDLCRMITTLTKLEDTKSVYSIEEYQCSLECVDLFVHSFQHLGELASNFLARYILWKGYISESTLNTTIELVTSTGEHWEVTWCALPTFIFETLTKKCDYRMSIGCWQTDAHCYWGLMSIYQVAKCMWSQHDGVCMASQPGFIRRMSIDTQPMAINHLMNNRFNTSKRSGTAVTTERVHGYNNSHNIKAYRGNIQHTMGMLNIHAYKKTKIAIYDEKHSKHHNNSSQWHQVTVQDHRNSMIELLKHSKALNKFRVFPKTNRSSQVQDDIEMEYKPRRDKKRRYEEFHKDSNNHNHNVSSKSQYHRMPANIINEKLSVCHFWYIFK